MNVLMIWKMKTEELGDNLKKILIIHNPYSGNQKNSKIIKKKLEDIGELYGYKVKFVKTKEKNDATRIVEKLNKNYDLVLSMGGDGTFNEVVRGNVKRKNPYILGHLPVGTTNDLKKSFYLPNNTVDAFKSILSGKVVSYDVMSVNGIPFTYTAGFGKLLDIPYETKKEHKQKLGYFAYFNDGVKDIITNPIKMYDITYDIDGKIYNDKTSIFLVSNSNRMGGINLYKDAIFNDSKFEVMISKTNNIIKLAVGIIQLQIFNKSKYYKIIRTDNIKVLIHDNDFKNWCIDGEKLEDKPQIYDIKVMKKIKCKVSKNAKNYV